MRHIGLFLLTYAALLLDASTVPYFQVQSITPNFLMIALGIAAITLGNWKALLWAAIIGLLGDCLQPYELGIGMFAAVAVVLGCQLLMRTRPQHARLPSSLTLLLVVIATLLLITIGRYFLSGSSDNFFSLMIRSSSVAVYSSLLGLLLLLFWSLCRRGIASLVLSHSSESFSKWNVLSR